jgi:hypothetical protein
MLHCWPCQLCGRRFGLQFVDGRRRGALGWDITAPFAAAACRQENEPSSKGLAQDGEGIHGTAQVAETGGQSSGRECLTFTQPSLIAANMKVA